MTLCISEQSHAETFQPEPYFVFSTTPEVEILNQQYDTQEKNYSVFNNKLYSNQRMRIFSYTAYDSAEISSRLKSGNLEINQLAELSISFGYGMELFINRRNKIGYEYLSSFPYDRGQLIRLFWVAVF